MPKRTRGLPDIASLLAGGFNEETARLLYAQGEEIAIFVMMQLTALAMKKSDYAGIRNSTKIITSNCQVNESFTHHEGHEEPRRIFLKNLRVPSCSSW